MFFGYFGVGNVLGSRKKSSLKGNEGNTIGICRTKS
jgi:hypothetical protein